MGNDGSFMVAHAKSLLLVFTSRTIYCPILRTPWGMENEVERCLIRADE